jgi:hypothetical protein
LNFKPLPDESATPNFVCRRIRKIGDANLLVKTLELLAEFEKEGNEMLVSKLGDLVEALHRCALLAQNTKQKVLIKRLKNSLRKSVKREL